MQTKSWLIIPVQVDAPGQVVNGIDYKIPEHVEVCSGVVFSSDSFMNKQDEYHVPILGNTSLWFNSKKAHIVHYFIDGLHPKELKRKYDVLKLWQPLKGGALIQGYLEDYGVATSYPYTMKIYLECDLKCTCNDKR